MTLALLVIGNGRLDYLHQAVDSVFDYGPDFDHLLMVDDSGDLTVGRELERTYPDFKIWHHPQNYGMAKAVDAGWFSVLGTDATHVLHWEEDFVAHQPLPVQEACDLLDVFPGVAQILFQRQPLTPDEEEAGSVLGAMHPYGGSTNVDWHRHIFSLNPCVIPREVLERGWPAGNEREMTDQLLQDGWVFGVWRDGPLVEHIGQERGKQWQL